MASHARSSMKRAWSPIGQAGFGVRIESAPEARRPWSRKAFRCEGGGALARFEFNLLRDQLKGQGVATMKPFSDFEFLRQAFTEGERWPVRRERAERLLSAGLITPVGEFRPSVVCQVNVWLFINCRRTVIP